MCSMSLILILCGQSFSIDIFRGHRWGSTWQWAVLSWKMVAVLSFLQIPKTISLFLVFFFFTSRVPYVLSFLVEPVVGKGGFYTEESVLEQL